MTDITTTAERKQQLLDKMSRVEVTDCKLEAQGPCPTCRGKGEIAAKRVVGETPTRRKKPTTCQTCVGEKKVFIYIVKYFSRSLGSKCEDRLASPVKLSVKDFKEK